MINKKCTSEVSDWCGVFNQPPGPSVWKNNRHEGYNMLPDTYSGISVPAIEQTHCVLVSHHSMGVRSFFIGLFFLYLPKRCRPTYSTVCCYMAGAMWNCCRHSLGARSLYIILPCTMLRPHFMVHSCLAVTCILHLQQNDQCYYGNTAGGTDTEKKKKEEE